MNFQSLAKAFFVPEYTTNAAGLPDFSFYSIPKSGKIYQTTTKYTKWPRIQQKAGKLAIPLQDPPKFTKIGIIGLKICHLAILQFSHFSPVRQT
jgi:hypothetical protein